MQVLNFIRPSNERILEVLSISLGGLSCLVPEIAPKKNSISTRFLFVICMSLDPRMHHASHFGCHHVHDYLEIMVIAVHPSGWTEPPVTRYRLPDKLLYRNSALLQRLMSRSACFYKYGCVKRRNEISCLGPSRSLPSESARGQQSMSIEGPWLSETDIIRSPPFRLWASVIVVCSQFRCRFQTVYCVRLESRTSIKFTPVCTVVVEHRHLSTLLCASSQLSYPTPWEPS